MYLVDTNIISELRKSESGKADPNVIAWVSQAPVDAPYLSAMSLFEL